MPLVGLTVEPLSVEVSVPESCTVGQWKQLVGDGLLGDKILYSSRLQCYCFDKTNVLGDEEAIPTLPQRIYVRGPNSVVKMVELALNKENGRHTKLTHPPYAKDSGRPPDRPNPTQLPVAPMRRQPQTPQTPSVEGGMTMAQRVMTSAAMWPKDSNSLLSVYSAGLQGMRPYMEDRACGYLELPGFPSASFFGVFDGHGGHQVAQLAAERMPRILAEKLKEGTEATEALKETFQAMDTELCLKGVFQRMGTTAVCTLILRESDQWRLLCANCGDSRAVLCRNRKALALSKDHKPHDPEERSRIERAGGRVELQGPCWRIDGGLNLSRALGDFLYKVKRDLPEDQQKVISVPEVEEVLLTDVDRFLVMASDGVFEIFSSDELIEELQKERRRGLSSWPAAIDNVLKKSWSSGDNVTICLVEFLTLRNLGLPVHTASTAP
ncbi:unnamed protein product [Durusdinium trenchii]|uniref:Uncharacterized protein n=2 Tax=Durusdinium trenchii TaxID=1381693 RepID=A0ABP0R364_9DINO